MAYIDHGSNYRRRLSKRRSKLKSLKRAKRQTLNKTIHDTRFRKWASISEKALGEIYKKGRTKFWLAKEWDPANQRYITVAKTFRRAWGRTTRETYDLETGNRIAKERMDDKGRYGVRYWADGSRTIRHESARGKRDEEIEISADGNVTTRQFTLRNYSETRTRNDGGPEIREVRNGNYHLKELIRPDGRRVKLYEKKGAREEIITVDGDGNPKERTIKGPGGYHEVQEIDEQGEPFTTLIRRGDYSLDRRRDKSSRAVESVETKGGKLLRHTVTDADGNLILNNHRTIRKGPLFRREELRDMNGNLLGAQVQRPFYSKNVDPMSVERKLFGRTRSRMPTANLLNDRFAQARAATQVPAAGQARLTPGQDATRYSPVPPPVPPKIPFETRPPASRLPPEGQAHSIQDPWAAQPPVPPKIPLDTRAPSAQQPLDWRAHSPQGLAPMQPPVQTAWSQPPAATQYPFGTQPPVQPSVETAWPRPPAAVSQPFPGGSRRIPQTLPEPKPVPLPGVPEQAGWGSSSHPRRLGQHPLSPVFEGAPASPRPVVGGATVGEHGDRRRPSASSARDDRSSGSESPGYSTDDDRSTTPPTSVDDDRGRASGRRRSVSPMSRDSSLRILGSRQSGISADGDAGNHAGAAPRPVSPLSRQPSGASFGVSGSQEITTPYQDASAFAPDFLTERGQAAYWQGLVRILTDASNASYDVSQEADRGQHAGADPRPVSPSPRPSAGSSGISGNQERAIPPRFDASAFSPDARNWRGVAATWQRMTELIREANANTYADLVGKDRGTHVGAAPVDATHSWQPNDERWQQVIAHWRDRCAILGGQVDDTRARLHGHDGSAVTDADPPGPNNGHWRAAAEYWTSQYNGEKDWIDRLKERLKDPHGVPVDAAPGHDAGAAPRSVSPVSRQPSGGRSSRPSFEAAAPHGSSTIEGQAAASAPGASNGVAGSRTGSGLHQLSSSASPQPASTVGNKERGQPSVQPVTVGSEGTFLKPRKARLKALANQAGSRFGPASPSREDDRGR